jgi:hypothetical protein
VLASTGFREKCIERVVSSSNSLVAWHLTIWLNAVLEAEELPACIANLDTTLANVQAKYFTHGCKEKKGKPGV